MKPLARAEAVARLKEIAARLGKKSLTRDEFARESGLSLDQIKRRFGNFSELRREADLSYPARGAVTDQELLMALRGAVLAHDGDLSFEKLRGSARYSFNTFRKRWGSWLSALRALTLWLEANEPRFPHLPALRARLACGPRPPLPPRLPVENRALGRIVNLPTLQHAPLTESGVVYLFGTLAEGLGFVVEAITSGYPDCLAKRRLDRDGERWTRVRIEFEQASRNFREHGHDPQGCDLIVCWHHNWPECPVEVLELSKVVRETGRRDALAHATANASRCG